MKPAEMFKFRSPEERKFLTILVATSWLCNASFGIHMSVLGPAQPYLAKNVGVTMDAINFIWTSGSIGGLLGALISGVCYKQYFRTKPQKMMFTGGTLCIAGIALLSVPLIKSFALILAVLFVTMFFFSAWSTTDCIIPVLTMGPDRSRPFTNALHAMVGVGFFAGTFLVRPFLPEDSKSEKGTSEVCNGEIKHNSSGKWSGVENSDDLEGVHNISWPFIITGLMTIAFSAGYFILALLPYEMPSHDNSSKMYQRLAQHEDGLEIIGEEELFPPPKKDPELHEDDKTRRSPSLAVIIPFVASFYFCSCGIERLFQSMGYTIALCGPLDLPPSRAALVNSFYQGGFLSGRLMSIVIAAAVRPAKMISASVIGCFLAASLLLGTAERSEYAFYAGAALIGFSVSWQFGSCYSWMAKQTDITGRLSPLFQIGCGLGGIAVPPLAGYAFTYRGTWDVLAIGFGLVTAISMVWVAGTSFFGLTSEHRDNDDEDDDDDVDDQKALFLEG